MQVDLNQVSTPLIEEPVPTELAHQRSQAVEQLVKDLVALMEVGKVCSIQVGILTKDLATPVVVTNVAPAVAPWTCYLEKGSPGVDQIFASICRMVRFQVDSNLVTVKVSDSIGGDYGQDRALN